MENQSGTILILYKGGAATVVAGWDVEVAQILDEYTAKGGANSTGKVCKNYRVRVFEVKTMEQAFVIRPIQVGEVEAARRLIYSVARGLFLPEKTLEEAAAYWDARGTLRDLEDVQGNYFENGGVFWVMVVDGQMVGTGAFRRYAEGVCELRRLWLLPAFQGRGWGYAMLMALIGRAREMGYGKMCLLTDRYSQSRAVAFYERVGFVETPHEGMDAEDMWMEMGI